jgi:hypothetical protein
MSPEQDKEDRLAREERASARARVEFLDHGGFTGENHHSATSFTPHSVLNPPAAPADEVIGALGYHHPVGWVGKSIIPEEGDRLGGQEQPTEIKR